MNDSELTIEEIAPYEASAYMDDYLLDLVGVDHADDCTVGAANIAIKKDDRTVGVVSFTLSGEYPLVHPKVKRRHSIYAKRVVQLGLDYLKELGFKVAFASIPDDRKQAAAIAASVGGEKVADNIYRRVL